MISASNATGVDVIGGEWGGNQAVQLSGGSDRDAFWFKDWRWIAISNLTVHDSPHDNINIINGGHIIISNVHSYNAGNNFRGGGIAVGPWHHAVRLYRLHRGELPCPRHAKGGVYFYTEDDTVSEILSNNLVQGDLVERTLTTGIEVGNRGTNDVCTSNIVRGNTVIDGGMDGEHMGIAVGGGAHCRGSALRRPLRRGGQHGLRDREIFLWERDRDDDPRLDLLQQHRSRHIDRRHRLPR